MMHVAAWGNRDAGSSPAVTRGYDSRTISIEIMDTGRFVLFAVSDLVVTAVVAIQMKRETIVFFTTITQTVWKILYDQFAR